MNSAILEYAAIFFVVWTIFDAIAESRAAKESCVSGYVMVRATSLHPFVQLIDDQGHGVRCAAEKEGK